MRIPPKRSRLTPKLLAKLRYYLNFSHAKVCAEKLQSLYYYLKRKKNTSHSMAKILKKRTK